MPFKCISHLEMSPRDLAILDGWDVLSTIQNEAGVGVPDAPLNNKMGE